MMELRREYVSKSTNKRTGETKIYRNKRLVGIVNNGQVIPTQMMRGMKSGYKGPERFLIGAFNRRPF